MAQKVKLEIFDLFVTCPSPLKIQIQPKTSRYDEVLCVEHSYSDSDKSSSARLLVRRKSLSELPPNNSVLFILVRTMKRTEWVFIQVFILFISFY